jgi:hypothetical protein
MSRGQKTSGCSTKRLMFLNFQVMWTVTGAVTLYYRKSTSGYALYMGGTAFTWLLKKQPIVTVSTCEAEYVAASLGVSHAIWLRRLLQELKCPQLESTEIRVDNKSSIELAKNPIHHERSKHIDVRFHLIREHIKDEEV